MFATLALLAVAIEGAFGYPRRLVRAVGHPVMLVGGLIAWCDRRWNNSVYSSIQRRALGTITAILCLILAFAAAITIVMTLAYIFPALVQIIITALISCTLIAQRSLYDHVASVAARLETEGVTLARVELSKIVGRDTQSLDEPAICRAAIESLAENFSDGVVAPVFWLTLASLPGITAYKAINTADSMIGHKTEKYKDFGWASARLDDIVNWPAARLSALYIILAAAVSPKANAKQALGCALRDARRHRSPNAGWPEAAMAGALRLKLAGPRVYNGRTVDEPWLGEGRDIASTVDIRTALTLYTRACIVQGAALAALAAMTFIL